MATKYLYLAVFSSGLSVMGVEMAASRLLAPHFGTSLIIWTSLIGIIMVALTIGYWLGGKLADRRPDASTFFKVQTAGGVLVMAIPFVADQVLKMSLKASQIGVLAGSFIGVAVLFAVPVGILGMASPFAIRLVSTDPAEAGKKAGNVYALSTAGSIVGTFLPGFVLIPHIGTKATILGFGALMTLVGVGGSLGQGRRAAAAAGAAGVLVAGLFARGGLGPLKALPRLLHARETPYNFVQVFHRKFENRAGQRNYLVLNEGRAVHSVYDPEAYFAPLVGGVWDSMNVAPVLAYNGAPLEGAVIGLAAGTVPNQWLGLYRDRWGMRVDGAEIDPGILQVGREYFSVAKDEASGGLTAYAQDGRTFLRSRAPASYDVVLTDAYKQPYIPFHLATREYFELVFSRLKPGGVMAINVGAIDVKAEIFRRLLSTMAAVFGEVRYVLVKNRGVPFNNHVVLGVKGDAQWQRLNPAVNPELPALARTLKNQALLRLYEKSWQNLTAFPDYDPARVFTDDLAPVEFYTEKMIVDFLAKGGPIPTA